MQEGARIVTTESNDPICILGGGVSGLFFCYYSGREAVLFEKEDRLGGLARSFDTQGVTCDIGPHIFFSRNQEILDFVTSLTPMHKLKRSNRILYKDRFIKYPFENELSALPEADRDWCLQTFLDNPYVGYKADDMLSFFYKTFGEGITRAYLEPYNRKIWKFEPAFMDTQMVERIPKPPREDIIASAAGEATEGYLHQLYFKYPDKGGTQSMIQTIADRCGARLTTNLSSAVEKVRCLPDGTFEIQAGGQSQVFPELVTTIPIHELMTIIEPAPPEKIRAAVDALRFNSIHITIVNVANDRLGDNFAVMVPHPDISFHRLSKIDFLGDKYNLPDSSTLMVEITYQAGGQYDLPATQISELVVEDLVRAKLTDRGGVHSAVTRSFQYAYVIYDLHHRRNIDLALAWLESLRIRSVGRFATFEYINMDQAVLRAKLAAEQEFV